MDFARLKLKPSRFCGNSCVPKIWVFLPFKNRLEFDVSGHWRGFGFPYFSPLNFVLLRSSSEAVHKTKKQQTIISSPLMVKTHRPQTKTRHSSKNPPGQHTPKKSVAEKYLKFGSCLNTGKQVDNEGFGTGFPS